MFNNYVYQAGQSVAKRTNAKLLDAQLLPRYWQTLKKGAEAGSILCWELDGPVPTGAQVGKVFSFPIKDENGKGRNFANLDLDEIRSANPVKGATVPVKPTEAITAAASDVAASTEDRLSRVEDILTELAKKLGV